nr:hypothetical protein [Tanacetum cinerariifolium]
KSPLDFADEDEASGRETAAPEMPPPEEVPVTTAPGSVQAVEAVVAGPPTVRGSRKRGPEGVDANAPPKSLRKDHTDRPSGIPDDVSDPDPLAFAGAPSLPPVDVAQYGVTVAKDPGSENASSPIEDPLDTPILDRLRRNGALIGLAQRYVAPVLSQNKVSKNSFKSLPMGLTRTMRESRKLVYGERESKGKNILDVTMMLRQEQTCWRRNEKLRILYHFIWLQKLRDFLLKALTK